jgi:hypothetical protein
VPFFFLQNLKDDDLHAKDSGGAARVAGGHPYICNISGAKRLAPEENWKTLLFNPGQVASFLSVLGDFRE